MSNWMISGDLMYRLYEILCEYPDGATAYRAAHRINYSHSHVRMVLNRMVLEHPAFVGYVEDTYRGMTRKTYFARHEGEIK